MRQMKKYMPEYVSLILYAIMNVILTLHHEPWFDEAESWLIARDASYFDILFVRPHYEGHPPLWHLILSIPAKLGMPYEPSIKTIQFIFAISMVSLILFKSPFCRPLRVILPFTYFFFYQYGVIARPYAMFCVAIFLTACFWKERDEKPWRIAFSFAWMCLCTAYGIVLAGGMAAVWVLKALLRERAAFLENKGRLAALSALFVFALSVVIIIYPASNALAVTLRKYLFVNNSLYQFILFVAVIPAETVISSVMSYGYIFFQDLPFVDIISASVYSLVLWVILGIQSKAKQNLALLIFPYVALGMVAAGAYFNSHHYGIVLAFFICIFWINEETEIYKEETVDDLGRTVPAVFLKAFLRSFLALCCIINIWWSADSFFNDLKYSYSYGKEFAKYVKRNHLEDKRWLDSWNVVRDKENEDIILLEDTHDLGDGALTANPYFNRSLVFNMHRGVAFETHEVASPEEARDEIAGWREEPDPDFIIAGIKDFEYISRKLDLRSKYAIVPITKFRWIWKAESNPLVPFSVYKRI